MTQGYRDAASGQVSIVPVSVSGWSRRRTPGSIRAAGELTWLRPCAQRVGTSGPQVDELGVRAPDLPSFTLPTFHSQAS